MMTPLNPQELAAIEKIEKASGFPLREKGAIQLIADLRDMGYVRDVMQAQEDHDPKAVDRSVEDAKQYLMDSWKRSTEMVQCGFVSIPEAVAVRDNGNAITPSRLPELRRIEKVPSTRSPSPYQEVLSHLIALEAAEDQEVLRFRSHVFRNLPNNLLASDEAVEEWIQHQRAYDRVPEIIPLGVPRTTLLYRAPDGGTRFVWAISPGGLFELSKLSARLAEKYHWYYADATSFILSGFRPLVEILGRAIDTHPSTCPKAMCRIELSIDPALPPHEVAQEYARIQLLITQKKSHPLSEKTVRLAEFAGTHLHRGAKEMKEWNDTWGKTHPKRDDQGRETYPWKYNPDSDADRGNFPRDCKNALQHVLNPDYQFPEQR